MNPALRVHADLPNTCVLEAPPGQEDEVAPLAIIAGDGVMVSRWELTEEDRRRIAEGGSVYLHVCGRGHPPVMLTTELEVEARQG